MKNGSQNNFNSDPDNQTIHALTNLFQSCKIEQSEKSSLLKAFRIASNATAPDINEVMRLVKVIRGVGKVRVPKPPIKFPVFQGGGAKGGAYIGAFEALDKMGHLEDVICPGGASAGGIVAFFMSLGFDSEQFKNISENLHFNDFLELKKNGWGEFLSGHPVGTVLDVIRYGAASPGKSVHHWASFYIEQVLGNKDATFRDLHEKMASDPTLKDLLLTATHFGTKRDAQAEQVFSYATTPDVVIADAFRATISYPGAFEPWEVRQKEVVNDQITFKSLGFFADGGILNNLPVTSFNSQYYNDEHYQTLERKDHRDLPVKVNPCVVGFSLTDLADLNDDITPITDRIKKLQQEHAKGTSTISKAEVAPGSWHLMDLAKAALWNTFGKPEPEDVADKHKIYFDQTVQVWPENVATLEFDVTKEKLDRIIQNAKNATELWLKKFRNPNDSYAYKKNYDDRLTKKEEKQKTKDPNGFFFTKLSELFIDFTKEINRQGKINPSDDAIANNARLRYLAEKLIAYTEAAKIVNVELPQNAFTHVCQILQQRALSVQENRQKRWDLILPAKIMENICEKFTSDPKVAGKLIKYQLSNILKLAEMNDGQFLQSLVKANNLILTEKILRKITKTLNQSYYQGKIGDPKEHLAKLLNNTNQSLIKIALTNNNLDMVKLLMKHGASVLHQNPTTGFNALQEAIALSNFEGFKMMAVTCSDANTSLANITIGTETLWQYIFRTASETFLSSLFEAINFLNSLINDKTDDNGMNIFHHLAVKGTAKAFSTAAYEVLPAGGYSKSLLTNKDFTGNSPLSYILQNNRIDILKSLIKAGVGKLCGYFTNGNYYFDQIFNIKDPSAANRSDYDELEKAYLNSPKLYNFMLKNFSSDNKANAVNERIIREVQFGEFDQALNKLNDAGIQQETIVFNPMVINNDLKNAAEDVCALGRRLSFSIAA